MANGNLKIRVEMRGWTKPVIFCWCMWCYLADREPAGRVLTWLAKYGFRYRVV